jgi:nicotinamide phosphoribosyltransferase
MNIAKAHIDMAEMGFDNPLDFVDMVKRTFTTFANPLLGTDVYKMGHMEQYAPGTTKVVSYLMARSDKNYTHTVFFGLQHWLKTYLARKLTVAMGQEFIENKDAILGLAKATGCTPREADEKILDLCKLGYIPIEIKAVPEGTVMPVQNVLATITNTLPEFYWCVGFFESLILKVWDAISTASCSFAYRHLVNTYWDITVDEDLFFLKQFAVHDFGYRGCSSEESALITATAHLLSFAGSDTVPAREYAIRMYHAKRDSLIMASVPASEHSVMCSFTKDDELLAFRNMLSLYPTGIVSIVSDTYNVYTVLTDFAETLKAEILARPEGSKVVFRPDSGNPEYIICGDPNAPEGSNEWKGAIRLLDEKFGSTLNKKGYKVLNPKVGLIYGDGMYLARFERTLARLASMGYAASNLVIGVGGILRNHSRDSLGFALKAIYIEKDGVGIAIEKDPVTDLKKKSHKGLVSLIRHADGRYETIDECTWVEEAESLLVPVFRDGKVLVQYTFDEIRNRVADAHTYPI